ncbi:biotin-dependent carboxylase-like uncharacterized protein [Palleronia aestuarii]|uniref:Biotin-dependent carboxylase-like uncharacterized protein n=1 Tax=Palleronia aestuarii TaxID=568105 RepID=A0A2W7NZD4_9RHOB|nr:biotin-dependent carboxyltransferase family protein [Palleronia aestuarii]PZX16572.1 biotin-dependent carboxylase-like uncharacterized protein [Palleronia aestuarii]
MTRLLLHEIGPGASVQDRGRPGYLAQGLSRGGAADRRALLEGAALLGQSPDLAALELTGRGGSFGVDAPARIALTGAPMRARLGERDLAWNASHRLAPGETLSLSPARRGVWSYLHLGGGIATEPQLGSRAAHFSMGLGQKLEAGGTLPLGEDPGGEANRVLDAEDRFGGGEIRILPSAHTALFPREDLERFCATTFTRDPRGNRQGVRLAHDGAPFATEGQLALVSEIIVPGDIQMTGEGTPYLLGPECQSVGGYPRIASILPADLPRALQTAPGGTLTFAFVDPEEAAREAETEEAYLRRISKTLRPLVRDPHDIPDLGRYQLISGVTAGRPDNGD